MRQATQKRSSVVIELLVVQSWTGLFKDVVITNMIRL